MSKHSFRDLVSRKNRE